MANHFGMAMIHAILTLHQRGWSTRRIARELGVSRSTICRDMAYLLRSIRVALTAERRRYRRPCGWTLIRQAVSEFCAGRSPIQLRKQSADLRDGRAQTHGPQQVS